MLVYVAVANRYYRIKYYEPTANPAAGAGSFIDLRIKHGATQLQNDNTYDKTLSGATSAANKSATTLCFVVTTFSAGVP
jgi:hypothetical protein